ncbi:MAG: hypothetical protein V1736_03485 [Pseudomonadota bacterium]
MWWRRCLAVALILASAVVARATCSAQEASDKLLYPRGWELGYEVEYFDYEEPTVDIGMDGIMHALHAQYTFRPGGKSGAVLSADGRLSGGTLEYQGRTWGGTPLEQDHDDAVVEFQGIAGNDFQVSTNARITVFVGLGRRYWNDEPSNGSGYEREIAYLYSPIGIEVAGTNGRDWSIAVRGEYDVFWDGEVMTHLSDVGYSDVTNNQDSGYGTRASVEVSRNLGHGFLAIRLFFRYWDIDKSDLQFSGRGTWSYEPENTTKESGLQVSYHF